MSRASLSILKHELRVMLSDPGTPIFVIAMPLLMVALMKNLYAGTLAGMGFQGTNGSEFAVPGLAVSFAAFNVGYAGFTFFRDHGWGTWDRLRATAATSTDIMIGKVLPTVLVIIVQLGVLFLLGGPLFDFHVRGSLLAIAVLIVVLAVALAAFGLLVTTLAKTMGQLNAIGSAGATAMAMVGGSWVPVDAMPEWAQVIAPAMPTYWAMEGFNDVILDGGGLGSIVGPTLALLGFGLLFALLAAWKFRFEDTKVYYG